MDSIFVYFENTIPSFEEKIISIIIIKIFSYFEKMQIKDGYDFEEINIVVHQFSPKNVCTYHSNRR